MPIFTDSQGKQWNFSLTEVASTPPVDPPPVLIAPVITSALSASLTVGNSFSYQILATQLPTSYAAAGLPAGLSINAAGFISGTPTIAGNLTVTLSATNSAGTGTATLALSIVAALPPPPPPVPGAFALGMNIGPVNDYQDRANTFTDVMKQARGFGTLANPTAPSGVTLDANGWPTQDCGVMFFAWVEDPLNRALTANYPSFYGTYSLSFIGKAEVSTTSNPFGRNTVQNLVYNPATNTTTADVVIDSASPADFILLFKNTNGGVKNLKLLRPGYKGSTQTFTNEFLNAIKPYACLRCMDMLKTNDTTVTSWSQRTLATNPTQNTENPGVSPSRYGGVAVEYIIELANTTGKDIWINVPFGADANYWTQLATLLKATLKPGIHVYVEYSNELWNSGFKSFNDNLAQATVDANGSNPDLKWNEPSNQYYWGYRRAGYITYKIAQAFAAVYGSGWMSTVRMVLPNQFVNPYLTENVLAYLAAKCAAPNTFLYAIGGAPYYGSGSLVYNSVPDIMAGLQADQAGIIASMSGPTYTGGAATYGKAKFPELAAFYGLQVIAYEWGPQMSEHTTAVLDEQASIDPGQAQLITTIVNAMKTAKYALACYYSLATPPTNRASGQWGAYNDATVPTVKSKALELNSK